MLSLWELRACSLCLRGDCSLRRKGNHVNKMVAISAITRHEPANTLVVLRGNPPSGWGSLLRESFREEVTWKSQSWTLRDFQEKKARTSKKRKGRGIRKSQMSLCLWEGCWIIWCGQRGFVRSSSEFKDVDTGHDIKFYLWASCWTNPGGKT